MTTSPPPKPRWRPTRRRPRLAAALDDADRAARSAELALAQRVAEQAGIDADWRVAEAAVAAARQLCERHDAEAARLRQQVDQLAREGDPGAQIAAAEARRAEAAAALAAAQAERTDLLTLRETLTAERDHTGSALAAARAELAGVEREHDALARDKAARARQAAGGTAPPRWPRCAWRRASNARWPPCSAAMPARRWGRRRRIPTGASGPAPKPTPRSLFAAAPRAAVPARTGGAFRAGARGRSRRGAGACPGEWLVTRAGYLRRWDGFVARGEGAAEAATLEAENRLVELAARCPRCATR
jgi:chromosome segregation protein